MNTTNLSAFIYIFFQASRSFPVSVDVGQAQVSVPILQSSKDETFPSSVKGVYDAIPA